MGNTVSLPFSGRRNNNAVTQSASGSNEKSFQAATAATSPHSTTTAATDATTPLRLSLWQRARRSLLRPWYAFRSLAAEAFVWILLPLLSSLATVSLLTSAISGSGWTAVLAFIVSPWPIFLCMSLWMTLGRSLISDRMDFVDQCPRCEHDTVHGVAPWPVWMSTPLRRFRCRECGLWTRETVTVLHNLQAAQTAGYVRPGRDGWSSTYIHQYPDAWILDGRTNAQPNDRVWIRRFAVVDDDQT